MGSFAPVTEEADVIDPEVQGRLPNDLNGLYLRNGPHPRFSPIGSSGRPGEADAPDPTVTLDYVQWPRLALGDSETSGSGRAADREGGSGLARAVIDPAAGTMRRTPLDDSHVEFPRVDDRLIGRRHSRCALAARTPGAELLSGEFDALRWYDTQGAAGSWPAGNLLVGEPVFAPVPGDPSEDHGYWMTYATDRTDGTSRLLVSVVLQVGVPAA
ncbi:carotenoid oxygenase family protein [Streptomyces sp. NPDC020794]|uniref:carotenoid oxygenase family protein n=1 Tax=unclassified Streptomyces TaxID=2593676 RepID=UPI0036F10837